MLLLSRFVVRHCNLFQRKIILGSQREQFGAKFAAALAVPARHYAAHSSTTTSSSGDSDSSSNDKLFADSKKLESLMPEEDILSRPVRERFGITKSMLIIVFGVYFGAVLAKLCAYVLEELDIFIDDDLDDD